VTVQPRLNKLHLAIGKCRRARIRQVLPLLLAVLGLRARTTRLDTFKEAEADAGENEAEKDEADNLENVFEKAVDLAEKRNGAAAGRVGL
jgi:hypothetical protein